LLDDVEIVDFEEVDEVMESDEVSSEQLEDVLTTFSEMDIEVVDAAHKVTVSKQREDVEALPPEEEIELDADKRGTPQDLDQLRACKIMQERASPTRRSRSGGTRWSTTSETSTRARSPRSCCAAAACRGRFPMWTRTMR
jgi:hypothetical protein